MPAASTRSGGARDVNSMRGSHAATLGAASNGPVTARSRPQTARSRLLAAVSDAVRAGCYNRPTNAGLPDPRPARGEGRAAAITLGGPRQRALLVALLLRAGRSCRRNSSSTSSTARSRRRRPSSLQNAVVALRKALGRRRSRHAPPRLRARRPARPDRRAPLRVGSSQTRAGRPPTSVDAARRVAHLWRGPALAEFAFEDWAQPESRRLEELRLVALEERIGTDIELGRAGRRRAGAGGTRPRASAARAPGAADAALYRAGRQADALEAFTAARAALDELGLEPGQDCVAPGRDPPRRGSGRPPTVTATRDADAES